VTDNLTIGQLMNNMPKVFHADRAQDVNADIQFRFSGEEPGNYVLGIHDGQASMTEGEVANPTATIETASEVWKAIALGQTNAMTAFMTGKVKATGDMGLLMRMQGMFG
jgi:putative sterol carrier protein